MFFQTLAVLLAATLVAGQSTDVVCMSEWSWVRYSDPGLLQSESI